MFEKLSTPEEIFSYKLGAALTMEKTALEMLEELQGKTQRDEIRQALHTHAEETRGHIAKFEEAFALLDEDVDDSPCPAIEGLQKEGQATIKMTDESVVDAVILAAAAETEHHEIAVYETLLTNAKARGATEVANLLRENLDQEKHALETVQKIGNRISTEGIAVHA